MRVLCLEAKDRETARNYVSDCEREYFASLQRTVSDIISEGNKVITLAGPTCSGKTTTANLLTEEIEKKGCRAIVRSIDDFYIDFPEERIIGNEPLDMDSVKTIDLAYFERYVKDLLLGKAVMTPVFDFYKRKRVSYKEYIPTSKDIYIFEGIQAVYPEIVSLLGEHTGVFISVEDDIDINGVKFSSDEIRLLRRIVRDERARGSSSEYTLFCWKNVRQNELNSIYPNISPTDYRINSFLGYEPFLLSTYALPLLERIDRESPFYGEAESLTERLKLLGGCCFDGDMVPDYSMFREFIGDRKGTT